MKKVTMLLMMAVFFLAVSTAQASGRSAAASQLEINAGHTFWATSDGTVSGFGAGSFNLTLNNGYSYLQGYGGARVSLDRLSIALLAVTKNDAFGWSVGPSLWLQYNDERSYFLAQYDYNTPFMSTVHKDNPALMGEDPPLPLHSYFLYSEYLYKLPNNTGIGWAQEETGTYETDIPLEFANGPFFKMGNLWLGCLYDPTPQIDGYDLWIMRFRLLL
jgi:hypothetical protein